MFRAPIRTASVVLVVALAGCGGDGDERADDVPEHAVTYPVSLILKDRREGRTYAATLDQASALRRKLDAGASFEELARSDSEDEPTRINGGFYGFADHHPESRFAGAVQAIAPGGTAGPVETDKGLMLIHRHRYEEGRSKEAATRVAVHGFLVTSREAVNGADRDPEEAKKMADEALRRIRAGEITLAEAAKTYGDAPPRRADVLLLVAARGGETDWLYRAVVSLPEGALVPQPAVGPNAYAVVARGRFFRAVVRHIVVAHALSEPKQAFRASRSRDEARALAEKALKEAKPDVASWDVLLTRYNDDPQGLGRHGTLGSVTTGMLIPELESVVVETKPGGIAPRLAETAAGFHVIWRVD